MILQTEAKIIHNLKALVTASSIYLYFCCSLSYEDELLNDCIIQNVDRPLGKTPLKHTLAETWNQVMTSLEGSQLPIGSMGLSKPNCEIIPSPSRLDKLCSDPPNKACHDRLTQSLPKHQEGTC